VLVRKNKEATAVVERLARAGVAAVQPKGGRVYDTDAFAQWRILLAALARPSDTRPRARAPRVVVRRRLARGGRRRRAHRRGCRPRAGRGATLLAADGMMALLAALRADADVAPRSHAPVSAA
jgi:hypothetical protein